MAVLNKVYVHILEGSGILSSHSDFLQSQIGKTLNKLESFIPISSLDIIVEHNPRAVIPETGECGYAPGPHVLYIYLDANRVDFEDIVINQIPCTLAHEVHHALRWRGPGYGKTLGEAIISEGLACHSAFEFTGKQQPWDHALNKKNLNKYLQQAISEWNKSPYNHSEWFYNTQKKGMPRWAGYSIGFFLVKNYKKRHPEETALSLVSLPAKEFVSDFK